MKRNVIRLACLTFTLVLLIALPAWADSHSGKIPAYVLSQLQGTCQEMNIQAGQLQTVSDVAALLSSSNQRVRAAAAYSLGESRNLQAVQPLMGALNDPDRHVRRIAASALGKIRDPRSAGALIVLLQSSKEIPVKVAVVESLGKIGGKSSLMAVSGYTNAESGWLRRASIEAKDNLVRYQTSVAQR